MWYNQYGKDTIRGIYMKTIIISALIFLIILAGVALFFVYMFFTKKPESSVNNYLKSSDEVLVSYDKTGNIIFLPKEAKNIAILFYPENLVEAEAYAPLCFKLANEGYGVVLIKPFLNISFFSNINAFKRLKSEKGVIHWVVIGHGSGGKVSSFLARKFPQKIKGIVFLASYPIFDISNYDIKSLVIYAEFDTIVNYEQIMKHFDEFPKDCEFFKIAGGNHSQFGYFGEIFGDGESLITKEKQQEILIEKIKEFLDSIQ